MPQNAAHRIALGLPGFVDALRFEPLEERAAWPDSWLPLPLLAAVAVPEPIMHSDTTAATRRPRIISGRSLLDSRTVDVVCRETASLVGIAREVNRSSLGGGHENSRLHTRRSHFRRCE